MVTFFIAIGVLCGICGVLAAALVVADRYVNNYGICTIDINEGGRRLEVDGGDSLLAALSREKIFIPSACGGRGSCGLCKVTIHAGAGAVFPTEEPHLSKDEIAANVRLSCQVKVREDMRIEIPEELFTIKEYRATVELIDDLTYDIKRVRLALEEPSSIAFTPGQYVQLECPPYTLNPEAVYRAYSIASDPTDDNHLEFIIRLVPKGICTTWVFEYLSEGDDVTLNGPHGDFQLHDDDREMIFIAGGSGMAPFCSMLPRLKVNGDQRRIRYFFGAKAARDLFYLETMREYEKELADFQFIPALSEPAPDDRWDGETGLITEVVGRYYQDCSDKRAYLCGSPGMIDACVRVLSERGLTEDCIFFDKFA